MRECRPVELAERVESARIALVIALEIGREFVTTHAVEVDDRLDAQSIHRLHELPNVCSHFVIDRDGTIHQLVPLGLMCRHTVGLNWTAIGIEHVGINDAEVLGDPAQMRASLRLTHWLMSRYDITLPNVIVTSHLAGVTRESRANVGRMVTPSSITCRSVRGKP